MGKKKHDAHYFNKKSCPTAPKPPNYDADRYSRKTHSSRAPSCCVCQKTPWFVPHRYPCHYAHLSMPYPYQTLVHSMATMLPITPAHPPVKCLCFLHRILPPAIRETQIAVRWRLLMCHSLPQHLVGWDSSKLPCGLNCYLSGRIISTGRDRRFPCGATHCVMRLCSIER